ncbi:MAG: glycosyltransferase [Parcubacteria group bacterium]|jgi:glycosyltransferase involved in cell wall biosynthesis
MRIAFFTNNYLPNPYGVSGSVESFRKEFERLGHEVFIFAAEWKGYKDNNPRVFRYPSIETRTKIKFPLAIPYSQEIHKILRDLNLDIIHSQHPNLLGSAAMHWAKKKNIPLVFTWHTLFDQYAHYFPFVPRKLAAWWTIRNAKNYANRCDTVVVPTPSVIEIIKNWGVTNKNIVSVPTGVEETQFANPNRETVRKKYEIKADDILLILISRLTAEKNVLFLAEAVSEIVKNNTKAKFMICGDGDLREKMMIIAKKKGVTDKLISAGMVQGQEKKDYYAAGDIFVYASKSETQGMVITEAMYSGLPIVAVRAAGVKDLIESGKTGFLVAEEKEEFGKAVQELIDDDNLRKILGETAKRAAKEKYTSSVCAKKMLEVYSNAISAK